MYKLTNTLDSSSREVFKKCYLFLKIFNDKNLVLHKPLIVSYL